jgi:L-seryl-tRNA(Ser) seleniumtransferase
LPERSVELRNLPSVDRVVEELADLRGIPRHVIVDEIRAVLAERREAIKAGANEASGSVADEVRTRLDELLTPSLRPVINATGVILHTNLGRAPLADFKPIPRYSNLEYDLKKGARGKRDVHTAKVLERLLQRPAIVVNNNAAAVYLVLHELAAGGEVLVSRGELIEIGDGFRIPEIMAHSGAILREVGTTNRTRIEDYRAAVTEKTRLILRVHPSNFRISGFTGRPSIDELAALGLECGIPVYEDLGSGCLVDLKAAGINEPLVSESLRQGVNLVSFSCDKLLGGPQSGIVAGDGDLVARVRRNPMYRAFRADKLIIEALEHTLRLLLLQDWNGIPTLAMIGTDAARLRERAGRVAANLDRFDVEIVATESPIGGGSTPDQTLASWAVVLNVANATRFEERLRRAPVPVIARIEGGKVILDMRTIAEDEEPALIAAVKAAKS